MPLTRAWSIYGRRGLFELNGSLGDLGTLFPLLTALVVINGLSPTAVFLTAGLTYIASGLYYRLPIPVQPLKVVAAIAIALGLPAVAVTASGLVMGAILLFLAASGLVGRLQAFFPRPIIRGLQLGVGLLLLRTGFGLVLGKSALAPGSSLPLSVALVLALVSVSLLLLLAGSRHLPASLLVLTLGAGVGSFFAPFPGLGEVGSHWPSVGLPSWGTLFTALALLVVPQIPLTLGNAVFATADTARTFFGPGARRVTPRALLLTMAGANIFSGLVGGAPICHGSGGLTAHYKLGARTGIAAVMLGSLLLGLALLGRGALPLLATIPMPVLGAFLLFVGLQHSLLARDVRGPQETAIALAIAATGFFTSNLALGMGAGIILYYLSRLLATRAPQPGVLHRKSGPDKPAS